ncbi:MAG: 7-carboxy-7-deazaguanine synthase QueE [Spirochaetia bacterium]|nr:7-carboxy-7-deazaguanine synthase QueE [Spirochaetia bacterium]
MTPNESKFLRVSESYTSVQGEGSHSGLPCHFIRTGVCDIRCSWCDTPQALSSGDFWSKEKILETIPAWIRLVQITGGEPLIQKASVIELSTILAAEPLGKKVLLETGGHRSLEGIPESVHIVMDIKLPGSGEDNHAFEKNFQYLKRSDEIKFVIKDQQDFEKTVSWIREYKLDKICNLLLSPVWGSVKLEKLVTWMLEESIDARIQTQLHKIIWGADATGV